jgi:hypothetical protein
MMSDEAGVATAPAPEIVGAVRAVAAPQPPPVESAIMNRILSMADHCLHDHLYRQAAEMYFEVVRRQGVGVPETEHARQCLIQIAEHYERTGNPHQARGIYEQLL